MEEKNGSCTERLLLENLARKHRRQGLTQKLRNDSNTKHSVDAMFIPSKTKIITYYWIRTGAIKGETAIVVDKSLHYWYWKCVWRILLTRSILDKYYNRFLLNTKFINPAHNQGEVWGLSPPFNQFELPIH